MPIQEGQLREGNDGERILSNRGVLSHYAHLKAGLSRKSLCRFCQHGVDGISQTIEVETPEPDVVQGDRSDKERDTAHSRVDEWFGREEDGQPPQG